MHCTVSMNKKAIDRTNQKEELTKSILLSIKPNKYLEKNSQI
ncbi:Uncharacterised protein [Sphingobacterium multivorum]|uniref:Uncharacterized protein n=1 Tax=Sphingobacterium multivorum TaxID=28454 RepID=A0A2X2J266_SPHMU|nr:Uncharacterised protein [Sphingobacterium multivorum]